MSSQPIDVVPPAEGAPVERDDPSGSGTSAGEGDERRFAPQPGRRAEGEDEADPGGQQPQQ